VHPPPPSYQQCKCGKIWNSYGIGSGGDLRTAQATMYLAREIPVRKDVILASKRTAARQLVTAEADSAAYVEQEFADWLMGQGTSLEALKLNPPELEAKLAEFLAERGGGDDLGEVAQHLGALDWSVPVSQGNGLNVQVAQTPDWSAGVHPSGEWTISRGDMSLLAQGRAPDPERAKQAIERHLRRVKAPGLTASRRQADGGPGNPTEDLNGTTSVYGGSRVADFTNIGPRWTGKTPGGPQGPGVGGLKQVTRYKGMSTPQLREMQRQMMTAQGQMMDPELLRELSFREVFASQIMGAIHDLTSPGPTPDADGTKTKRTDPGMKAAEDWHHRDQAGRWQRSDGHPTKVKAV